MTRPKTRCCASPPPPFMLVKKKLVSPGIIPTYALASMALPAILWHRLSTTLSLPAMDHCMPPPPPHSCSVGTVPSLPHHLSSLTAVSLSLFHCSPSHQLYQLLVVFFWLITSLDMMLFVFVLLKLYIEIVRATLLKS